MTLRPAGILRKKSISAYVEWFEELSKKIMGSLDEMQTDNIDREALRTIRSSMLTREIHFKE